MTPELFNRPIPGQSLTSEPGSVPWEKPSQFSDPLDAFEMYMDKLSDDEALEDIMDMLDIGIPISVVAGSMLSMGVMEGMHTVDVKLLLKPLLIQQIKILADAVGVEYKVTMGDYRDRDAEAKKKRANKLAAKLALKVDASSGTQDEGDQIMQQAQVTLEQPEQEMPVQEEAAPQGLMAKEQM